MFHVYHSKDPLFYIYSKDPEQKTDISNGVNHWVDSKIATNELQFWGSTHAINP